MKSQHRITLFNILMCTSLKVKTSQIYQELHYKVSTSTRKGKTQVTSSYLPLLISLETQLSTTNLGVFGNTSTFRKLREACGGEDGEMKGTSNGVRMLAGRDNIS